MVGKWLRTSRATARSCTITPSTRIACQRGQGIHQLRQLLLLDQGVEGDVDPPVMGMGIAQHPLHLGQAEVLGPGAGGEILQTGVDRIGALFHGGKEGFQRSGRGQKFRFVFLRGHFGSHSVTNERITLSVSPAKSKVFTTSQHVQ